MAAEKQFISIHSLRMEGDQRLGKSPEPRNISIHSLRMEGDYIDLGYLCGGVYFNPLPPHGGRPAVSEPPFCLGTFQSTPSAWRETLYSLLDINKENSFQSTPSAWRETYIRMDIVTHQIFQSTPSAWRETQPIPIKPTKVTISIHSLRMEGDCHMFLTYPAA